MKIRLILFLWVAVCAFFTVNYYHLVNTNDVRTIYKLAVVFWVVQGLIALAAFVMSFRGKSTNSVRENRPD
ncbi:MAG: hypothetical protein JXR87_05315 [Candidatus Marinimicrobia bacterium]|nr:hypothetical protein [Candidatus Neomarinimicrobiota bacterium]